jgi:hypothetical protein
LKWLEKNAYLPFAVNPAVKMSGVMSGVMRFIRKPMCPTFSQSKAVKTELKT